MKRSYESPEIDYIKLSFESLMGTLDDSKPNIPEEGGDQGGDD